MTAVEFVEACSTGDLAAVRAALDGGANVDTSIPYHDGESVYHAAELNHREVLELLLAHGADPNVTSGDDREAPLHRVAQHGWLRVAALLKA